MRSSSASVVETASAYVRPIVRYRRCKGCDEIRPIEEFEFGLRGRAALHCGSCRPKQRARRSSSKHSGPDRQVYDRGWYAQNRSRLAEARKARRQADPWPTWAWRTLRARRLAGEEVAVGWSDLRAILERQRYRCALTGLPFWSEGSPGGSAAWDSPSLDRISHDGPYSKKNLRVVLHCMNTFRGRMRDEKMIEVALALISRHGKRKAP